MTKKQFDLEQQILDCWHITDDLDTLATGVMEHGYDEDKVANIVLGLKELYHIKFEKCFETFESFLKDYYNVIHNLKD